jgi:hypothetical protein
MISNLRSKPIEGHVTDSAGNILRNAQIIIKQQTPNGSYMVDIVQSDDAGYFISDPLPNGTYDIYESGIKISRIIHNTGMQGIQCFQAAIENYDTSIMKNFSDLITAKNLNLYKAFIQIEPSNIDNSKFGSIFPIYDKDISSPPDPHYTNELWKIANFFNFSTHSRITISRFDVEYFSPLTQSSNSYKRIKWAGVPAIRFYSDSKLVLPLDYYSMVANNPKAISPADDTYLNSDKVSFTLSSNILTIQDVGAYTNLETLSVSLFAGDILKVRFVNRTVPTDFKFWYGIVDVIGGIKTTISLENWKGSRFVSSSGIDSGTYEVDKIFAFDGMFSNIIDISQEVNQLFNVVENNYAQNNENELYNYNNS